MATTTPPRDNGTQNLQFLRKTVTYEDAGSAVEVGVLPANAKVFKAISGVQVTTAFDGGGTDLIDVGYGAYVDGDGSDVSADPDAWATDIDASSTGWTILDETAADFFADASSAGVQVTATYADASGDASAGSAEIIIAYVADN